VLQAKRLLAARLKDVAGIRIEDKNLCFTVHYRGVSSRNVGRARAILGAVLAPFGSAIRMLEGKKVWEILPTEAGGKGVAVQDALAKLHSRVLPIYIGDDVTDEYAFAALPQGLTVRVGRPGRTKARYWLRNPSEVKEFLARLNAETRGHSPAKTWVPGAASRHREIGVPRLPEAPNSMTGGDS
jgi:trehalose-phosphatase